MAKKIILVVYPPGPDEEYKIEAVVSEKLAGWLKKHGLDMESVALIDGHIIKGFGSPSMPKLVKNAEQISI